MLQIQTPYYDDAIIDHSAFWIIANDQNQTEIKPAIPKHLDRSIPAKRFGQIQPSDRIHHSAYDSQIPYSTVPISQIPICWTIETSIHNPSRFQCIFLTKTHYGITPIYYLKPDNANIVTIPHVMCVPSPSTSDQFWNPSNRSIIDHSISFQDAPSTPRQGHVIVYAAKETVHGSVQPFVVAQTQKPIDTSAKSVELVWDFQRVNLTDRTNLTVAFVTDSVHVTQNPIAVFWDSAPYCIHSLGWEFPRSIAWSIQDAIKATETPMPPTHPKPIRSTTTFDSKPLTDKSKHPTKHHNNNKDKDSSTYTIALLAILIVAAIGLIACTIHFVQGATKQAPQVPLPMENLDTLLKTNQFQPAPLPQTARRYISTVRA